MLNFGLSEMILVMVLALVVIGPDRLPEVLRFLGRHYGKLMRVSNDLRRAFMLEAESVEVERRAEELRRRREEARRRLQAQREANQENDRDDPFISPQAAAFAPASTFPTASSTPSPTLVPPTATIVPPVADPPAPGEPEKKESKR